MLARNVDYLAGEIRGSGATALDLSCDVSNSRADNRSVSRHSQGPRRARSAPLQRRQRHLRNYHGDHARTVRSRLARQRLRRVRRSQGSRART